jgi:O-antigen/teichoic acid export membrane protein
MLAESKFIPPFLRPLLHRLKKSPLASRFAHGVFWSAVGSMTSRVLALASSVFAARMIGKAAYGDLGVVQNTVAMVATFAGFGMGVAGSKFVAEFRTKDRLKTGRMIALFRLSSWGLGIVLGLLLAAIAPWLCRSVLRAPELVNYVRISSLLMLLTAVNGSQNGVLSGFEAFKSIARINTVAGILNCALIIGGAYYAGLSGIVWGMIGGQLAACLLSARALRQEMARYDVPITFSNWSAELPVIWHFSVPAVLGGILITPVTWACTALLIRQPGGQEQMGAFNAANQWFGALMFFPYMLNQASLPIFSELFGAKDGRSTAKVLRAMIKINAAVALPLVTVGCLLSPFIMKGYGKAFSHDWPTLIAVLLAAGLFTLQIPVGNIIAAAGRMWLGLGLNFLWSLVFIGATLILLPRGSLGLATARTFAYLAQGVLSFVYATILIRRNREPAKNSGGVTPLPPL